VVCGKHRDYLACGCVLVCEGIWRVAEILRYMQKFQILSMGQR
jgi:hypothetical protein